MRWAAVAVGVLAVLAGSALVYAPRGQQPPVAGVEAEPELQGEPGSLRAHADALSRIVREFPADTSWLDDLDALVAAGGTATFVIPAAGDGLGWRVEGTGPIFAAALREVGYGRIPRTLLGNADGWAVPDRSAMEVVLGDAGWARVEGSEPQGETITLGNGWMNFLSTRGDPGAGDLWDRGPAAAVAAEPLVAWSVLWYAADGSSGSATRLTEPGGRGWYLPSGEGEDRDRIALDAGGPAQECIQRLTTAGVTGHEARLLKAFAELGADRCTVLRSHGEPAGPHTWSVEIAAPVEATKPLK